MNEIFKDYALDQEDEEYVRIWMLFQHRNGETQTKCLYFRKNYENNSEDVFRDFGDKLQAFWICICSTQSWQFTEDHWKCSKCNNTVDRRSKFCPHCGAKMDGE